MTQSRGNSFSAALSALASRFVPSYGQAAAATHPEKELEMQRVEQWFSHAADHVDLQQMELDWSRRDGGGMRAW
jgi:hypothetical protein